MGVKTHSDGREKMSDVDAGGSVDFDEARDAPERWLELLTLYTKLQIHQTRHADEHRVVTRYGHP